MKIKRVVAINNSHYYSKEQIIDLVEYNNESYTIIPYLGINFLLLFPKKDFTECEIQPNNLNMNQNEINRKEKLNDLKVRLTEFQKFKEKMTRSISSGEKIFSLESVKILDNKIEQIRKEFYFLNTYITVDWNSGQTVVRDMFTREIIC